MQIQIGEPANLLPLLWFMWCSCRCSLFQLYMSYELWI